MSKPKAFKCEVCGYIHEGDAPPDSCPVCGAPADMFSPYEPAAPSPSPAATTAQGTKEIGRIVVIGAGIAGLTAAEHARRTSPAATITLITKPSEGLPYYRLNLTRYLAGEIGSEALAIKDAAWYDQQHIEVRSIDALRIDRDRRIVVLSDAQTLVYDRLVLATGAHAFIPPISGSRLPAVTALRCMDDAKALLSHAKPGRRAVVIGGGILGIEAAVGMARQGSAVTVLEKADRLLSRQLAAIAADLLLARLKALGLTIRLGVSVAEIVDQGTTKGVRLSSAEVLTADVVLIAAGIRPEVALAREAGLVVNNGIIVDDALATSDPTVFAAGDAAEHRGTIYGIWPAAYGQGVIAGTNAAGGALQFARLTPSNRLKVLDTNVLSVGEFAADDEAIRVVERQDGKSAVRLVLRGKVLVGANLYGDTGLDSLVSQAIESAVPLTEKQSSLLHINKKD